MLKTTWKNSRAASGGSAKPVVYISATSAETEKWLSPTLSADAMRLYGRLKWAADFKTGAAGWFKPLTAQGLAGEIQSSLAAIGSALVALEQIGLVSNRQLGPKGRITLQLPMSPANKNGGSAGAASILPVAHIPTMGAQLSNAPAQTEAPADVEDTSDDWDDELDAAGDEGPCAAEKRELACLSTGFNTNSILSLSTEGTESAAAPHGAAAPPADGGPAFGNPSLASEPPQPHKRFGPVLDKHGFRMIEGKLSLGLYKQWDLWGLSVSQVEAAAMAVIADQGDMVPLSVQHKLAGSRISERARSSNRGQVAL